MKSGSLVDELRQAALLARLGRRPDRALTVRQALEMATIGGARLPRPGSRASARWSPASSPTWRCGGWTRCGTPASPTRSRPWCWARAPPLELLLVNGRPVVERDQLVTVDEAAAAAAASRASAKLLARAGQRAAAGAGR